MIANQQLSAVFAGGATAAALELRALALAVQPARLGGSRGACTDPRRGGCEGGGEAALKPLQRQLAIAVLASRILCNSDHPGTELCADQLLLLVGQRLGREHVERGLNPRRGHVRVLAAGA